MQQQKQGNQKQIFGVLAEFSTPHDIYHACEQVRDKGYRVWDAHTPFPVHGLERAMGLSRSKIPFIVLFMALLGGTCGFSLQYWIHVIEYPLVISGKPFLSWPAFIPVTFELSVLFGAFGAVFGMFGLNQLPTFYHSVFRSARFARVTDDKFFISIEATDPQFDQTTTTNLLKSAGAVNVEVLEL